MTNISHYFNEYFYENEGVLYWKKCLKSDILPGTRAGHLNKDGYWRTILQGKSLLNHRIIFYLHNGYIPEIIDHIDRDRGNNKIENLRPATNLLNTRNSTIPSNNTTGVKGVRVVKGGKFEARVCKDRQTYQVGTFETLEGAKEAVRSFREELHGEFHCHG